MRHCILDSCVAQGRTCNSCSSGLLTHLCSPFKLIAKEGKAEYSKQDKAVRFTFKSKNSSFCTIQMQSLKIKHLLMRSETIASDVTVIYRLRAEHQKPIQTSQWPWHLPWATFFIFFNKDIFFLLSRIFWSWILSRHLEIDLQIQSSIVVRDKKKLPTSLVLIAGIWNSQKTVNAGNCLSMNNTEWYVSLLTNLLCFWRSCKRPFTNSVKSPKGKILRKTFMHYAVGFCG